MKISRRNRDVELNEEFRDHLEREIQKNIADGMAPDEARRRAAIALGAIESAKEECREQHLSYWIETTLQDLGYGLRLLRKSPGFTCIAIAILALGIGANTAIFSAVNATLFARWPFPHPEKIVIIAEGAPAKPGWSLVSVPNFEDYSREQKTFDQLALWISQSINLTGQERPDRLIGSFVSANFFELFGTKPQLGRLFLPGEDQSGAENVAVLSHDAWQTRFGADPNILGRHMTLNNETYAVVGVLPAGFHLPFESDVYITAQHQTSYKRDRATRVLLMIGRIKPQVSHGQAEANLNTIARRLAREYPETSANINVAVTELRDMMNRFVRKPLIFLLVAVAVVLLIACANLANLLLSRSTQRQREMAVRAALGARRSRTIRQLFAETMIIAVFGGMAGVALAYWTLPALLRLAPSSFDLGSVAVLDSRVLLFSLGLVFLTGVLFGVAPALHSSHINVATALASGSRGTAQTGTRERVRTAFVVFQVAMSVVLLTGAILLLRSFQALLATETGMDTRNLLTMEYRLPRNRYTNSEAQAAFHRQIAARVAQVPGVVSSAVVRSLPFSGNFGQIRFVVPDRPAPEKGKEPIAYANSVTPGYFATAGIPVLSGRIFDDHDSPQARTVSVISRAVAERYFHGEDPVGRSLQIVDNNSSIDGQPMIIVGVVGNAKQMSLRDNDEAEIYTCYSQDPGIFGTLVVRTTVDPMSLADPVRQAVWSIDNDQPVWKVRTLAFLVERDVESDRFLMVLMLAFGVLALGLTALGTYGVLSNAVNQRQREIGVRMAMGAQPSALRGLVLARGMKLALVGGLIGVAAAAAGTRLVSSLLYGISPLDPAAFITSFATMQFVAFLASYVPAYRATRVDPMRALRCD